jgi:hypothetical protein
MDGSAAFRKGGAYPSPLNRHCAFGDDLLNVRLDPELLAVARHWAVIRGDSSEPLAAGL